MFGHVPDMPRRPVWDAEHAQQIARERAQEELGRLSGRAVSLSESMTKLIRALDVAHESAAKLHALTLEALRK